MCFQAEGMRRAREHATEADVVLLLFEVLGRAMPAVRMGHRSDLEWQQAGAVDPCALETACSMSAQESTTIPSAFTVQCAWLCGRCFR